MLSTHRPTACALVWYFQRNGTFFRRIGVDFFVFVAAFFFVAFFFGAAFFFAAAFFFGAAFFFRAGIYKSPGNVEGRSLADLGPAALCSTTTMQKRTCPRCGPEGDVVSSAPGVAACRACQGSFVSSKVLVPALLAAGVTPAQLKEIVSKEGRKLRPCPTCEQVLTTFPVRRELLHSCASCNAMWLDDGALLRLGGIDPEKLKPAPLPTGAVQGTALELAARAEGLPAAGPMKPVEPTPLPSQDDDNPLGMFAPQGKKITVDDVSFVPEVGSFSERGGSGATFLSLGLKLLMAAIVLGGMYLAVTTAFMPGAPTDIGGGYEALFWDQPVKHDTVAYNGGTVQRWVSPWGTNTLEAIYYPGGGGAGTEISVNGKPEGIVGHFHGWTRMPGGCSPSNRVPGLTSCEIEFVDERDPNKTNKNIGGYCLYWFNTADAWVLCGYSDSNIFARSGKSTSFSDSIRKKSK